MKNIRRFANQNEFNAYKNSSSYIEPHVSITDGVGLSYNVEFPKVRILTKIASGNNYKYTTTPNIYDLFPKHSSEGLQSVSCTVYFNNVLFTNATTLKYTTTSWTDQWHDEMHLGANSNSPTYIYYIHAEVAEGGGEWDKYAILPDSFGEVGDEITVRIFRN